MFVAPLQRLVVTARGYLSAPDRRRSGECIHRASHELVVDFFCSCPTSFIRFGCLVTALRGYLSAPGRRRFGECIHRASHELVVDFFLAALRVLLDLGVLRWLDYLP